MTDRPPYRIRTHRVHRIEVYPNGVTTYLLPLGGVYHRLQFLDGVTGLAFNLYATSRFSGCEHVLGGFWIPTTVRAFYPRINSRDLFRLRLEILNKTDEHKFLTVVARESQKI